MRRKIIRQGNHSYTLTLPIEWIREEEISEGQDVELTEESGQLVVTLPNTRERPEHVATVDVRKITENEERTIRNILNQLYRKGYSKITFSTRDRGQLMIIKDIVKHSLLGFDTVEEKDTGCIVKSIAEPSSENYVAIMNKLFFIIKDDGSEIVTEMLKGKLTQLDKHLETKNTFDNYTNFLRRIVVRDKIGGAKDSYSNHMIVARLSLIQHAYYYLYKFLTKQKSAKLPKETMTLLTDVNAMFELLRQAYFDRNLDKAHQVGLLKDKLLFGKLYQLLQHSKGADSIVLYHIGEIIRLTHMVSTNVIGLVEYPEVGYIR